MLTGLEEKYEKEKEAHKNIFGNDNDDDDEDEWGGSQDRYNIPNGKS